MLLPLTPWSTVPLGITLLVAVLIGLTSGRRGVLPVLSALAGAVVGMAAGTTIFVGVAVPIAETTTSGPFGGLVYLVFANIFGTILGGAVGARLGVLLWSPSTRADRLLVGGALAVAAVLAVALTIITTVGLENLLRVVKQFTPGERAELVRSFTGQGDPTVSLDLNADGQILVSGGNGGTVAIWETSSGRLLHSLPVDKVTVGALDLSQDGRTLVTNTTASQITVWDVGSGAQINTLRAQEFGTSALLLTADGATLVGGGFDGSLQLWDVASGQVRTTVKLHDGAIYNLALSPDGRVLASAGDDGTIRLVSLPDGELIRTISTPDELVANVAVSLDGQRVISHNGEAGLSIWDLTSGESTGAIVVGPKELQWFGLHPDGETVVGLVRRGEGLYRIQRWNLDTGERVYDLYTSIGDTLVADAVVSADGGTLLAGSTSYSLAVTEWELPVR